MTSKIKLIKEYFGENKDITKIKRDDIQKFRLYLRNDKMFKPATINRYISLLRRAYNLAKMDGLISSNPCDGIKKLKENNIRDRVLTYEEQDKLMPFLPPYTALVVEIALQTGFRRNNLLNLRWEQVDIANRYIHIPGSEMKSGYDFDMPISPVLMSKLKEIGVKESGYILYNPKTSKPYNNIYKGLHGACKKAGIADITLHNLRHTFATRVNDVTDSVTAEMLLDHHSMEMTRRYIHPDNQKKFKALEVLNSNEQ